MMKNLAWRWIELPLATAMILLFASPVVTQSESKSKESKAPTVTVIGQNICLGCSLKKERGAQAQCSVYGHRHVIRVEKVVTESGKELSELKGIALHYLDTDKSKDLVGGHHGERMKVTGRYYGPERVIEVESFEGVEEASSGSTSKMEEMSSKFDQGSCCYTAYQAGKTCSHPCCIKTLAMGKVCTSCNPG